ncbi:TIGR00725 family protein [Paenibacillus macerans]|jgi:uncharacterized protein (TIGR00725 family)|uniref:TIGR00725 family protein n=1 Tax=Paenibacillus TaxID=44249 RepID=UPI000979C517|nr:TIGR00725 family protein [Paenibacillus macerans]MEC0139128.1 TIGR00725 family protein [Paenibacillus macerans]OMG46522.1 TIGR00725 family protein [Paenibacillus macerans]GBK64700.1 hypothetical protein PbDSM24746_47040 [Paenibacillus macerans]GBK70866.1 hypothetical protein PbJCM17693_45740 [Paenibacillus macerans]
MVKNICVIGKWKDETPETLRLAEQVGEMIAARGSRLVTGGGPGVMEAACKGAKRHNGLTIGFLATRDIEQEANPYLDIIIPTGMGYDVRSSLAIRSSDAVIMVGGGNGTLGEASVAYLEQVPLIVLLGTGGWADKLPGFLYEGKYFDERRNMEVKFASSPAEAAELAMAAERVKASEPAKYAI